MVDMGIVTLLALCITAPLAAYSIFVLTKKIIEILQIRKGCIKGLWLLPNKQQLVSIVKPEGREVKVKILGKDLTYQYDSNLLTFEGSTPIQVWDYKNSKPIDLTNLKKQDNISAEDISVLIIKAFNLGAISAMKDDKMIQLLVMLACGLAAVAAITGFLSMQQTGALSDLLKPIVPVINNIWGAVGA
jgi:hypothetical protein